MISTQIITIAADTANYGLKKNTKIVASHKNKFCGDKITVELNITNKIIKKMSYESESCVFCQASANLLAKYIKNKKIKKIDLFLKKIKKHKNFKKLLETKQRINCILLPFGALKKAINRTK